MMWITYPLWLTNDRWVKAPLTVRRLWYFPKKSPSTPSVHVWCCSKCKGLHQWAIGSVIVVLLHCVMIVTLKKICEIIILRVKSYRMGRCSAQLVVWASHVQRICPHCSGPGFDTRPGALFCESPPPSLILFSSIKSQKAKKKKKKKTVTGCRFKVVLYVLRLLSAQ